MVKEVSSVRAKVCLGLGVGLLAWGSAEAVEGGAPITPPGVYEFGSGILPPTTPNGTVGMRISSSGATDLRDGSGKRSSTKPDLRVNGYSLAYIRMTEQTLAGARYGWGAVVPALDSSIDLRISTPGGPLALSGKNQALGDMLLIPLIMQWTPSPGLFTNFQLTLQAPTGSYDKQRLINTGSNHWTASPSFAFTSIQPGGFEVSSWFQLNFNQRNDATNYRSGIEYSHDFAVGQHVGPWTVGLGGFIYQQITDDKAPGLTNGNRSRARALGPALSYFNPSSGLPVVSAHIYKEFDARNRTQGFTAAIRLGWSI